MEKELDGRDVHDNITMPLFEEALEELTKETGIKLDLKLKDGYYVNSGTQLAYHFFSKGMEMTPQVVMMDVLS